LNEQTLLTPVGSRAHVGERSGVSGLLYRFDRLFGRLPPRPYRLDDYKLWFPKTADVFLRFLKRWKALPVMNGDERPTVGVVVVPWLCTPAPWHSIMLAIGLARRGRKIVLLWDDTGFPEEHLDAQNRAIGRVLSYVGRFFPVVQLSDEQPHAPRETDAQAIGELADQNVAWRLRGAPPTASDLPLVHDIGVSLEHSLPLVRSAVHRADLDCLVVPGGAYGTSGLFRLVAGELGRRAATFDVDVNVALVCTSGIAAQNADIPRAFAALWDSGDEVRSQAIDTARAEFQRRTDNRDSYGFQPVPAGGSGSIADESVLMPLNVEWDAAALGKHVHFTNTVEWVTSTITAILDSGAGPVIVRQHPSERRKSHRSKLDIASVIRDRFGDDHRCQFVAADDPVSTYDLLRSARLVLPFVSTIAIEAAAIGKPVLISGASYYADLGFVWSASSRDEYFALLRQGLQGDLEPLPDQSDRAWICYYLTAVRNRISTDFTPHPDHFWQWCRRAPDSLFADPEVSDMLEAIDCDVPVSLLRHRRISTPNGG
jgi:hypothetical protein